MRQHILEATARVVVPDDARLRFAANGQPVGFTLADGREVSPILALDVDGKVLGTDAEMRSLGFEVLEYMGETGVVW